MAVFCIEKLLYPKGNKTQEKDTKRLESLHRTGSTVFGTILDFTV